MKIQGVKLVIWVLLLTILLASIGTFVLLGIKAGRQHDRYAYAEQSIAKKDWRAAKFFIGHILNKDRNSERAMQMYVMVARGEGNPPLEALWLGRLMKINEFKASYAAEYRNALLKLRDLRRFGDAIDAMPKAIRTPDDDAWLVYCRYHTLPKVDSLKAWKTWKETRHNDETSDVRELAEITYSQEGKTIDERISMFEQLSSSANGAVRLEALMNMARLHSEAGRMSEVEKLARSAVEIDYYAAMPLLIDTVLMEGRALEAVNLRGEYLRRFPSVGRAIEQSEWLTLLGHADELGQIAKLFNDNDYSTIALIGYIDALVAYSKKDMKLVAEKLQPILKVIQTPCSRMMSIESAIALDAPDKLRSLERDWNELKSMKSFIGCRERSYDLMKSMIMKGLGAGVPAIKFASLASAMQSADYAKEDLDLTRLILMAGLGNRTVPMEEFSNALMRHPDDVGLLGIVGEASLQYGKPKETMRLAECIRNLATNSVMAASLTLRARFAIAMASGTKEDLKLATRELSTYLAVVKSPGASDLGNCWRYVNATMQPEDIRMLGSVNDEYASYCSALMLKVAGRNKEFLDSLGKLQAKTPDLRFWSAARLAEGNRNDEAIAIYESLPEDYPNALGVKLNLSELYAAVGKSEQAMKMAVFAWERLPGHPQMQACYARRLSERGEWSKILEITHLPTDPGKADVKLVKVWSIAMEKSICENWNVENYFAVRDSCQQLLRYVPTSNVARDYLARFDKWQSQRKRIGVGEK